MASSGGQCNHIDHVKTQLPYALVTATLAFLSYLIAGWIISMGISYGWAAVITLAIGFLMFAGFVVIVRFMNRKNAEL